MGLKILCTGGIGDWFVHDSHWSDDYRKSISDIYLATSRAKQLRYLIEANKFYRNVRVHELQDRVFEHWRIDDFQNETEVREHFKDLPATAIDMSIRKSFPTYDKYYGSTYLQQDFFYQPSQPLAEYPYVVVVPASIHGRAFTLLDWQVVRGFLRKVGVLGVLLYAGEIKCKKDPLFEDLTNQTTLLQSIEILKHAIGFIGIDSCLAVLACQLFPKDQMAIISNNPQYMENARHYCAPHKDFPFVVEGLRF